MKQESTEVYTIVDVLTDLKRGKTQAQKKLPSESSNPIFQLDRDGIIVYANQAAKLFLKNWGLQVNDSIQECVTTDHSPKLIQDASFEALTCQISKTVQITQKENTYLFFVVPLPRSGYVYIHGIDLSERKKESDDSGWREENHRKLFEEAMDAVFVADAQTGIIVDCNHAAAELMDMPQSDIVGKHQRFLHPPNECTGEFTQSFEQCRLKDGGLFQCQVMTKKGQIKDVLIKANFVEIEGKKMLQGIFRDITAKRQLERRLRELAYKLNDLSAGGCFICESHEKCFKAYADLTLYGLPGLCIVREDPQKVIDDYSIKPNDIKVLSSRPLGTFETLPSLQAVSIEITQALKTNPSCIILLDGLEYLLTQSGFEAVYGFIQEKRFDFIETGALLLIPLNMGALGEREKALLTSEVKILDSKEN